MPSHAELITTNLMGRFWTKVSKTAGCWLWTGSARPGKYGAYGTFRHRGRLQPAHRFIWEQLRGPIPRGLCVCHTCDNPSCVNIEHLFLGTKSENALDCWTKARHRPTRLLGVRNPSAKLSESAVRSIRTRRSAGEYLKAIAWDFGVSEATVSMICNHKIWAWMDD